jgi:hypothetical protein
MSAAHVAYPSFLHANARTVTTLEVNGLGSIPWIESDGAPCSLALIVPFILDGMPFVGMRSHVVKDRIDKWLIIYFSISSRPLGVLGFDVIDHGLQRVAGWRRHAWVRVTRGGGGVNVAQANVPPHHASAVPASCVDIANGRR